MSNIALGESSDIRTSCNDYLSQRRGTYDFRCIRYNAAYRTMRAHPTFNKWDTVVDVGAGRMEFGRCIGEHGHLGYYLPLDGSIDGINLETWNPFEYTEALSQVDWFVAIEFLEHIKQPYTLMHRLAAVARKGVVITTSNPAVVDVRAIDPTHVTPIPLGAFGDMGWKATTHKFFVEDNDSILGWWFS